MDELIIECRVCGSKIENYRHDLCEDCHGKLFILMFDTNKTEYRMLRELIRSKGQK